ASRARNDDLTDGRGPSLTAPRSISIPLVMDTLARLENTIAERRKAASSESYVAQLNARGLPVMARKLGEEAVEVTIAAISDTREELIGESADLLFHLLVLLSARDISIADVLAELDRR